MASYYQLYGDIYYEEENRKTEEDILDELELYCERDDRENMRLTIESISRYGTLPDLSNILGYAIMRDSVKCVQFLVEEIKVKNDRCLEFARGFRSEKCIKYFNGAQ